MNLLGIKSIKTVDRSKKVYDIEVKDVHQYLINGKIVSHNSVGSYFPQNVMGGGSAAYYLSSVIIEFTKSQEKTGTEVSGAILTAKSMKNRFAKEKSKVKFTVSFEGGLNPYSGLLSWCEEEKVFEKDGRGYIFEGQKFTKKELSDPVFWDTLLAGKLGELLKNKFTYKASTGGLLDDEDAISAGDEE